MKIAAGIAALYLMVVVLMALAQDWLLFPRWAATGGGVALPANAERLSLRIASGDLIVGVHFPAQVPPPVVTPFDSLRALAREHYPWLPAALLLRHRMEIADSLAGVAAPVAVISAAADAIVPPRRTELVRWSVRNLVLTT